MRGFDGEGYGLAAIRNPKGPVAVIGSHGECFGGMVDLALDGFLDGFFGKEPPERLGEVWLKMKASLAKKSLPLYFPLLDAADGDPKIPAATQRREHQEMFVLLGDPALRLPAIRRDLRVTWQGKVAPGEEIHIRGTVPKRLKGGEVRIAVERPLTSMLDKMPPLPKEGENAPRPCSGSTSARIISSWHLRRQRCRGTVSRRGCGYPRSLPWARLTLRVYVATERADGLAALTLPVEKR